MTEVDETPNAEPWVATPQPIAITCVKYAGVAASSLLVLVLIERIGSVLLDSTRAWLVLPASLLGYLLADLLSGTVHWFCDTFFESSTPFIGKVIIQPFRDHHVHPQRITCYRFIEQDTTNFFMMLPPLAIAFWLEAPRLESAHALFWCSLLTGLSIGSFGTNLFHKWAHMGRPPTIVRWLQRGGLILESARHQRHHRDHGKAFCVTSGWLNPPLDAIRFFPHLERIVRFFQR